MYFLIYNEPCEEIVLIIIIILHKNNSESIDILIILIREPFCSLTRSTTCFRMIHNYLEFK